MKPELGKVKPADEAGEYIVKKCLVNEQPAAALGVVQPATRSYALFRELGDRTQAALGNYSLAP